MLRFSSMPFPASPGNLPREISPPRSFLDLPARRKKPVRLPPRRVLLSFGGEDRQGLSRKLIEALLREELFAPQEPHESWKVRCSRRAGSAPR